MQASNSPDNKTDPILKEFNRQQSTGSSRCYVMKLPEKARLPDEKKFEDMPFQCNSIYLRHGDKLYYINKVDKIYEEVEISSEGLTLWDKTLRPHDKAKPIAKRDLAIVSKLMLGHLPPSEERRLEWYKLRLTEKRKKEQQKQLEQKDRMSSEKLLQLLAIKKKWIEKRKKDTLVAVNLKGNHSEEFDELVHGQQVKKSINFDKLQQLEKALAVANWADAIFTDPQLSELALSLFSSSKITYQQTVTVLERVQTLKSNAASRLEQLTSFAKEKLLPKFGIYYSLTSEQKKYNYTGTFSVLDEKQQFTSFAKEILVPALSGFFYPLSAAQIEELKPLIAELPPSEQKIYTIDGSRYHDHIYSVSPFFGGQLILQEGVHYHHPSQSILVLSAGIRDALGLVRYKKNYVSMRPTFGEKSPLEIEDGLRWPHKKRFGALRYRGTKPYGEVHEFARFGTLTDFEATWHDIYHSKKMSTLPLNIQNAILYLIDQVREAIADDIISPLSKEIWDWIDCEISYFLKDDMLQIIDAVRNHQLSPSEMTHHFFNSLMFRPEKNYLTTSVNHWFGENETFLSTMGTILFLSAINDREKWQNFQIDLAQLPSSNSLYPFYQDITKIYSLLKNEPLKIQLIKIDLYQTLKKNPAGEEHFATLCQLISKNQEWIIEKFHFKKLTKKLLATYNKPPAFENRIITTYNGSIDQQMRYLLEDLAAKEESIGDANKADYARAILDLNYTPEETRQYIALKKQKYSTNEAQFLLRPSLWKWIKCNKLASLLLLPIFYGLYQTKKMHPLLTVTVPASPSSPLPSIVPTGQSVTEGRPSYEDRVQKSTENLQKNDEIWENAKEKRKQSIGPPSSTGPLFEAPLVRSNR